MKKRLYKMIYIVITVLFVFPTTTPAATLNVIDGQLVGASGINVNGVLLDVDFIDGTCVEIYSGCDTSTLDFYFQSRSTAEEASRILSREVIIDGFDLHPELILGIEAKIAWIITPYTFYELPGRRSVLGVPAVTPEKYNSTYHPIGFSPIHDLSEGINFTYARWSEHQK